MKAETDSLWERVPQALRDEYRACWRRYGQHPSPETYARARRLEDKLEQAKRVASQELRRQKQRKDAETVR